MPTIPTPNIQRRWKALPGEPVGDAGDPYTGYDRFGRTERMRWGKVETGGSFTPLVDVKWGYDQNSQKTWKKDALAPPSTAQDQIFTYDELVQLTMRQAGMLNINHTAVVGIPAQQENFSYDETGNWKAYQKHVNGAAVIDQSRVNNKSNQVTQIDGSSTGVSYDKNGNMLTVPTGDALSDPSNRVVWDGWNRPVRVYDADDSLIAEYRYDGLGRRITVTTAGVTRHTYYDDQWRSIEERINDSTTPERQHVWHPGDRWELLLRDRSTANNGVMDERLYPMKDQFDPVALADASGNVVERYAYSAFGIPSFLNPDFTPKDGNTSSYLWNFLFHAEFQDAETGWFNYGYRYYVPTLGRWLSRDPIGEDGGENLYVMGENNLPNFFDAYGLKSKMPYPLPNFDRDKLHQYPGERPIPKYIYLNEGDLFSQQDSIDTFAPPKRKICCYTVQTQGSKSDVYDHNGSWFCSIKCRASDSTIQKILSKIDNSATKAYKPCDKKNSKNCDKKKTILTETNVKAYFVVSKCVCVNKYEKIEVIIHYC